MPHHHGPHHGPHHGHGHGHGHGWFEFDRKIVTRQEFGEEVKTLGELVADNAEITFGDVLITLPEELTIETVFEKNPHGKYVLRVHAEWPEYETPRSPRSGRPPKFGQPRRPGSEG